MRDCKMGPGYSCPTCGQDTYSDFEEYQLDHDEKYKEQGDHIASLETKLQIAVSALDEIDCCGPDGMPHAKYVAREALKKIQGDE